MVNKLTVLLRIVVGWLVDKLTVALRIVGRSALDLPRAKD